MYVESFDTNQEFAQWLRARVARALPCDADYSDKLLALADELDPPGDGDDGDGDEDDDETPAVDFILTDNGTTWGLSPTSDECVAFFDEHFPQTEIEGWQWIGSTLVVDWRVGQGIVADLKGAGFKPIDLHGETCQQPESPDIKLDVTGERLDSIGAKEKVHLITEEFLQAIIKRLDRADMDAIKAEVIIETIPVFIKE